MNQSRNALVAGLVTLCLIGLIGVVVVGSAGADNGADTSASVADSEPESNTSVSEDAYVEPAPEPGDTYYEASSDDWVSYINPRDEYRSPYLGDGSGKIGVTLLNEAGEPIVGETVPNTTVTIPTGEELEWHTSADPLTVQFPLTDHYDRPLDADQFGTTDDLPQGDGYMDSHTLEMHGQPEDATIEYGEAQIEGEHADKIEVVGYIQQAHEAWDSDVDPIEDAESYEEAGGGWTFHPDGSHGQAIVVLQLDGETTGAGADVGGDGSESPGNGENANESNGDDDEPVLSSESNESDDTSSDGDEMPGFGVTAVITALALVAFAASRRLDPDS